MGFYTSILIIGDRNIAHYSIVCINMSYGLYNYCELLEISLVKGNEKLLLIITLFFLLNAGKYMTSNV